MYSCHFETGLNIIGSSAAAASGSGGPACGGGGRLLMVHGVVDNIVDVECR